MLTRKQYELLVFLDERLGATGVAPSFEEMKVALGLRSKSGIHRLISALEERGFIRRLPHRARALEILRRPGDAAPDALTRADASAGSAADDDGPAFPGPLPPADRDPATGGRGGRRRGRFAPNVIQGDFSSPTPGPLPAAMVPEAVEAIPLPLLGKIAAGTPIAALCDTSTHIEVPAGLLGTGEHYALTVEGDSMIEAGILDGDTVLLRRCDTADSGTIVVALVDDSEATLKRLHRKGQSIALEPANPDYPTQVLSADRVRVQGRLVGLLRRY